MLFNIFLPPNGPFSGFFAPLCRPADSPSNGSDIKKIARVIIEPGRNFLSQKCALTSKQP